MAKSVIGIVECPRLKLDVLCVDHDHITGKVRGLLCSPCNLALGNIKESLSNAEGLVNYIKTKLLI